MAKEQSAEVKLKYAAATVHTYELFGRAIVAAALAQAAKRAASGKQSAMTATVSVAPIEREEAQRSRVPAMPAEVQQKAR